MPNTLWKEFMITCETSLKSKSMTECYNVKKNKVSKKLEHCLEKSKIVI